MEAFLYVLSAVLLCLCAGLLILYLRDVRKADTLKEKIEDYVRNGNPTALCLSDDRFAALWNDVCELQNRIENEKQKSRESDKETLDFVADVSHQLKTPLAGLRLYTEMRSDSDEYKRRELELIEKTERLVQGLLKLQKLRADAFPFSFEEWELSELIGQEIQLFRPMFPQTEISFSGSALLRCDRQWLGEAVGNIIKNACEHGDRLNIRVEKAERSILLVFEDNGGGVSEKELPLLFRRFYKSEGASPASTGLGLAITKEIAEKHHGTLTAENTGKGLKITLCLPVLDGNIKV